MDDLDRWDDDWVVEFLEVVQTLVEDALALLDERQHPKNPNGALSARESTLRNLRIRCG